MSTTCSGASVPDGSTGISLRGRILVPATEPVSLSAPHDTGAGDVSARKTGDATVT